MAADQWLMTGLRSFSGRPRILLICSALFYRIISRVWL